MNKGSTRGNAWTWKATGAVFGLVTGVLAALLGGLLTAGTWVFGVQPHPWLQSFGTGLLVSTIPLLLFAGCCLDWMEREPKKTVNAKSRTVDGERGAASWPHIASVAFAFLLLCAAPIKLQAQQTIFNVPTTDVLPRGQVYGELDASLKPNDSDALSRFSSFVPRIVVGAGGRTEIGLNITGNIQPGADTTTLVPTVKYKLYDGGANGYALVVGDNLFVPVRNRPYRIGNYVYLNGSKTIGKTRLTAGVYHFSRDVVAANAERAGGQFGFEQTINSRFTIAADWLTGKHANGYFTPGIVFKLNKRVTGYAGYSIGNASARQGNHFFLLELGYNFR